MAAEKTIKRKKKSGEAAGASGNELALRTQDDARSERRFEPTASAMAVISTVVMSIGAVLVGAGFYGQWLRSAEAGPHLGEPVLFFLLDVMGDVLDQYRGLGIEVLSPGRHAR